ncbi:MAG: acyltransferase [Maricaulaceae bacterium]
MSIFKSIFTPVKIRDGHDNFFTPLRLIFASLVVIGHAYVIVGGGSEHEPHVFYHYTFSYIAVNMFFIASGFLVTKSMLYRGDSPSFISARALRIYPALIVHVLFIMLIIGPFATNLSLKEFFSSPDWYLQPLKVLSFYETNMELPGIFSTNSEQLGSGALWTLRYEFLAYIATWLLFLVGALRYKWMIAAQFFLPCLAWIVCKELGLFQYLPATFESLGRFGIAYGLGAAIYAYREKISFSALLIPVFLLGTWVARDHVAVLEIFMNLMIAWGVMIVAYMKAPSLAWTQKLSDVSYGIYIYHWAILQSLYYAFPDMSVWPLIIIGYAITLLISEASWHYIEKPALRLKGPTSMFFQGIMNKMGFAQKKVA